MLFDHLYVLKHFLLCDKVLALVSKSLPAVEWHQDLRSLGFQIVVPENPVGIETVEVSGVGCSSHV